MTCRLFLALSGLVNFELSLKFFRVGGKKSNFNSGGCFNSIAVFVISIETVRLNQGCDVKGHFEIVLVNDWQNLRPDQWPV